MGQVLIVENDQAQRKFMRAVFEDEGYRVTEAVEGNAALDCLRRSHERFVVLLDYSMPGMDGKQLLQLVSRDGVLSIRHAYVLMTARRRLSLPADVVQTLSLPVVYKPFDLEALLLTVAQAQWRLEARS